METLWFWIVGGMLTLYVVLDGMDLGAGIVHLLLAWDESDKRKVIASIGPIWSANEVWLLAAGGSLYCAFPSVYASAFSGFYLPLMMVLWLMILRGISLELRNHIPGPLWAPMWDVVFTISSLLLTVVFGAALGNVVRGVPLDASGYFFVPLWTNFSTSGALGVLDWYTVLTGLAATIVLTMHGALWVAHKTEGGLQFRAQELARLMWTGSIVFVLAITGASFIVQPDIVKHFSTNPIGAIFPVIGAVGLVLARPAR